MIEPPFAHAEKGGKFRERERRMGEPRLCALAQFGGKRSEPALLFKRRHRKRLRGGGDRGFIRIARDAVLDAVLVIVCLAAGGNSVQLFQRALRAEHGEKIGDRLAALDVTYVLLAARHKFAKICEQMRL